MLIVVVSFELFCYPPPPFLTPCAHETHCPFPHCHPPCPSTYPSCIPIALIPIHSSHTHLHFFLNVTKPIPSHYSVHIPPMHVATFLSLHHVLHAHFLSTCMKPCMEPCMPPPFYAHLTHACRHLSLTSSFHVTHPMHAPIAIKPIVSYPFSFPSPFLSLARSISLIPCMHP